MGLGQVLQGMYKGKEGKPAVILEAVAPYDTWIWHAFFGMPSTLNDINVLNCSPFSVTLVCGECSILPYILHRTERTNAYFLADGFCTTVVGEKNCFAPPRWR